MWYYWVFWRLRRQKFGGGEESFRRFKEIYALILGIPAEESKDYCLFKLEGETVELYFIEVENEYSIIVVYTIL